MNNREPALVSLNSGILAMNVNILLDAISDANITAHCGLIPPLLQALVVSVVTVSTSGLVLIALSAVLIVKTVAVLIVHAFTVCVLLGGLGQIASSLILLLRFISI